MLYCEAKVYRAGLANRLFPWARCRIHSQVNDVPMLATRWAQIAPGALVRRENDPRIYVNLFTRSARDIGGWRRTYVKLRAKRIVEPEHPTDRVTQHGDGNLITFEGMRGQFHELNGWHELVRRELLAITRPIWRKKSESISYPFIGVHVRRGDFRPASVDIDLTKVDNTCTPLSWFVDALKAVRAQASRDIAAIVTSDGKPEELRDLLKIPHVHLVSTGSAIGDLLLLSRSALLLASGSSFSAWASFLGQMPTVSHPGQNLGRLFRLSGGEQHFVGEFDPAASLFDMRLLTQQSRI